MKFESVLLSVDQSKADIAMAGLTVNEERKAYVTFSNTYYNASQKVIVKESDNTFKDCKTAADIEKILSELKDGTKVGYQNGTTGSLYIDGDEDWGFAGFENIKGVGYDSGSLAVQDMMNGNIEYVVIDEEPANSITKAINELA